MLNVFINIILYFPLIQANFTKTSTEDVLNFSSVPSIKESAKKEELYPYLSLPK